MSNINTAAINVSYPIAGQDNDTQGFRDNFSNIVGALSTAKTEITALQTNAVLTANLTTNGTVVNNLAGSTISNGILNQMYQIAYVNTVNSATYLDLTNGSTQSFTMTADVAFTFTNWPASGQVGFMRLFLSSDGATPRTATFFTANGGTVKYGNAGISPTGFPSTFQTPAQTVRTLAAQANALATTLTFGDVQNIQIGNTVGGNGAIPAGTTVTGVNINTSVVTLSQAITSTMTSSTAVTFGYAGPRLLEAITFNGGATVYLYQVADF